MEPQKRNCTLSGHPVCGNEFAYSMISVVTRDARTRVISQQNSCGGAACECLSQFQSCACSGEVAFVAQGTAA